MRLQGLSSCDFETARIGQLCLKLYRLIRDIGILIISYIINGLNKMEGLNVSYFKREGLGSLLFKMIGTTYVFLKIEGLNS